MIHPSELFERFVAHGVTTQEIYEMGLDDVVRSIAELRAEEPDNIDATDAEIAEAIWTYATFDIMS